MGHMMLNEPVMWGYNADRRQTGQPVATLQRTSTAAMKQTTPASLLLALVALSWAWVMVVCGGCRITEAYEVDEDEPRARTSQRVVPAYRKPHAPRRDGPTGKPLGPGREPPVFLSRLQDASERHPPAKYKLDDQYNRYHRRDCPYGPQLKPGHSLEVQGSKLVHRPEQKDAGTMMSREEIKAKGYKPCKYCRPDLDIPPETYEPQDPTRREIAR